VRPDPGAEIKALPKAELHRHLEGCVSVPSIIRLAARHGTKLPSSDPAELEKLTKLKAPMGSLDEVLAMFTIAQSAFASYEAVEELTWEALETAFRDENIRLLELRFSPDFMLGGKDLDWRRSLDIMHSVVRRFESRHPFVGGLIVIASRGLGLASAERTASFAIENRKKVIGFDLAEGEKAFPARLYATLAKKLRDAGLPLTVHSGEEGDHSQVRDTLELLRPARIGHGVKAADDRTGRTIEMMRAAGVTVETNPWSNYLTRAVEAPGKHPLKKFLDAGLKCSISADDPAILDTDLNREYALALGPLGLKRADLDLCRRFAVEGSFLDPDRRRQAAKETGL
jgi:adenosine deaminase